MKPEDISILVVDRLAHTGENDFEGLDEHIGLLRESGYKVEKETVPIRLNQGYDIIIAHPSWAGINSYVRFHKEKPEIPIIICSHAQKPDQEKEYAEGFLTDDIGIIYPRNGHCEKEELLKLVDRLAGYRRDG